jgi:hypothetical protein
MVTIHEIPGMNLGLAGSDAKQQQEPDVDKLMQQSEHRMVLRSALMEYGLNESDLYALRKKGGQSDKKIQPITVRSALGVITITSVRYTNESLMLTIKDSTGKTIPSISAIQVFKPDCNR